MELLPAHQPLLEDDTDEELSDQQIRELLNEAAIRMRAKAAGKPTAAPDVPFKLPKLRPGHLADTHERTDGNITRLDHSKLVDKKQQALANGIKKIDDPLAVKRLKKLEVRTFFVILYNWHVYGNVQTGRWIETLRHSIGYAPVNQPARLYIAIRYHNTPPVMIIIPISY
jgi:hypothetical protein